MPPPSDPDFAILNSYEKYTAFSFSGTMLIVRTYDNLEKYTKVLRWDNGYIEMMAKYSNREEEVEEYIDLVSVLEEQHTDAEVFLRQIKGVMIEYHGVSAADPRMEA